MIESVENKLLDRRIAFEITGMAAEDDLKTFQEDGGAGIFDSPTKILNHNSNSKNN